MANDLNYAEVLRRLLTHRKMTQRALAKVSGVEADVISKVVTGRTKAPALGTWRAICQALHATLDGVTLEDTLEGKEDRSRGGIQMESKGRWVLATWSDFMGLPVGSERRILGFGSGMLTAEVCKDARGEKYLLVREPTMSGRGRRASWKPMKK